MTPRSRRVARLIAPLAAAVALALSACGAQPPAGGGSSASAPPSSTAPADSFPVTVDTPNGEVTIPKKPERIVSLSPSATEVLFAIGAGKQVVAADSFSNYPPEAPKTDLSGFEPNVEAITAYKPDLVVAAIDGNDLVASLTKVNIPVIVSPAPTTWDGGFDGMAALGLATGHVDETAAAIATMRADLDKAFSAAPKEKVRVYHELDDKYFAASSYSFIGSVYTKLGAENIADAADPNKTGYPQLTQEAIIEADPQLIVISDLLSYTAEDVKKRPGWQNISAVKNDNVVVVDADIASRWGPRLPQLVTSLAEALNSVKVAAQ